MLRQMLAQPKALSKADERTLKKVYALDILYLEWPELQRRAETEKRTFVGHMSVVFPHWRETATSPISIKLNDLYRQSLEEEANSWGLSVFVQEDKVYVRKISEVRIEQDWEF